MEPEIYTEHWAGTLSQFEQRCPGGASNKLREEQGLRATRRCRRQKVLVALPSAP